MNHYTKDLEENNKRAQTIVALRKSRIKRAILGYLSKIYPKSSYPAEIAEEINATPSNVLYAIKGSDGRYNTSLSLISLGLVEGEEISKQKFYRLTSGGLETFSKVLKKEEEQI